MKKVVPQYNYFFVNAFDITIIHRLNNTMVTTTTPGGSSNHQDGGSAEKEEGGREEGGTHGGQGAGRDWNGKKADK